MLSILLPTASQSLALACLLAVVLGMAAIGAVVGGRDRLAEADLPVGWAVVSGLFVVLGAWLRLPLDVVAGLALVLALAAAAVLWRRRQMPWDPGMLRCLAAMAPLMAATASMEPSQWDEFAQWLPNARYLVMFGNFPGPGLPESDSVFPAYPPAMTVPYFLASRLGGDLFITVAPWFNLLLLAATARLLVRQFRGGSDTVSWTGAVWGVMGVTLLSTTFVPKLVLSGYADAATAVVFGFCAVLGMEVLRRPAAIRQFGAVFALLPMTKQGNFSLMALLLGALGVVWLLKGEKVGPSLRRGLVMVLPAALAILAWRLHVTSGQGEMVVRPPSQWEWHLLKPMLTSMKDVALAKGGYFGLGLVLLAASAARWRRPDLLTVFGLCFCGYNLFLFFVYLAILGGYESANAASYWRYNTHMGILEMLAAAGVLGLLAEERLKPLARLGLILGGVAVVVGPFAGFRFIRFDDNPLKANARQVTAEIAALLGPEASLELVDARGTGFYAKFAEYHLGFGRQVVGGVNVFNAAEAKYVAAELARSQPAHIWLRSQSPVVMGVLGIEADPLASHLLERGEGGWRIIRSWPFPPGSDPAAEKD